MADITLADYTGYLFLELIKARQMADAYSRQVAEMYAKDKVLQHFSVPRFKVSKIDLTIPVLVSGARFKQVMRFNMGLDEFKAFVQGLINDAVGTVRRSNKPILRSEVVPVGPGPVVRASDPQGAMERLVTDFWGQLRDNPDPSQPDDIVRDNWTRILEQALTDAKLEEAYKSSSPNDDLFQKTQSQLLTKVTTNTAIDSTTIQGLLINPETNVVKNGSSEASVFTIRVEMQEEGLFIAEVRDASTGDTRTVVEFE